MPSKRTILLINLVFLVPALLLLMFVLVIPGIHRAADSCGTYLGSEVSQASTIDIHYGVTGVTCVYRDNTTHRELVRKYFSYL